MIERRGKPFSSLMLDVAGGAVSDIRMEGCRLMRKKPIICRVAARAGSVRHALNRRMTGVAPIGEKRMGLGKLPRAYAGEPAGRRDFAARIIAVQEPHHYRHSRQSDEE